MCRKTTIHNFNGIKLSGGINVRNHKCRADEAQDLHEAALQLRTVPFRRLFEFANACDYLIIAIGIIFILLSGLFLPWIVYGYVASFD